MKNYTTPLYELNAFNCPHCGAYSHQKWLGIAQTIFHNAYTAKTATCNRCEKYSIWQDEKMIYPDNSGIEDPNSDLNDSIKIDYLEASSIVNRSPRGACALLRLTIEKLCNQLIGDDNKKLDLDKKIELLKTKGLTDRIYKNLHTVRIVGNEAVHCGELNLMDNMEVAKQLFYLVNRIAEELITNPKKDEDMFKSLPKNKSAEIENRIQKIVN